MRCNGLVILDALLFYLSSQSQHFVIATDLCTVALQSCRLFSRKILLTMSLLGCEPVCFLEYVELLFVQFVSLLHIGNSGADQIHLLVVMLKQFFVVLFGNYTLLLHQTQTHLIQFQQHSNRSGFVCTSILQGLDSFDLGTCELVKSGGVLSYLINRRLG